MFTRPFDDRTASDYGQANDFQGCDPVRSGLTNGQTADYLSAIHGMHQFRQPRNGLNQPGGQNSAQRPIKTPGDRSSADFYTNRTNNHVNTRVNSYLNNLNLDYQQYSSLFSQSVAHSAPSFISPHNLSPHQTSFVHSPLNQAPHQTSSHQCSPSFNQTPSLNQTSSFKTSSSSSSSSLSSTSSLYSKKLIVQENAKLNSNLANFVSKSQVTTSKSAPFEQVNCSLVWSNVSYKVKEREFDFSFRQPFSWTKQREKLILNNISGHVESGELVALVGPSGVGKSSLLEILAGRRVKGTSGKVSIDLQHLKFKGIHLDKSELKSQESNNWNKIAFIPQKDHHLGWLTVYETLLYSSKIKNCKLAKKIVHKQAKLRSNLELYLNSTAGQKASGHSKLGHSQFAGLALHQSQLSAEQLPFGSSVQTEEEYHQAIVINILKDLSLENCMHNLVNTCSGGQLRRLSIGLELLHQPRLILIDEPTTGLDFSSALKCIQTLRCLTMMNKPPGIIASIHQPSSLVLHQFHRVYALAKGGQCIYEGTVDNLVDYFSSFHINCPLYFNPADFSIQIANGDFGAQLITKLAEHQIKLHETRCNEMSSNFKVQLNNQLNSQHHLSESSGFALPAYQVSHLKVNVKHLMKRLNRKTHPTLAHTSLLLQRSWKSTIREPTLTWLRLFQFVFTAFLIANLHNYNVGEIDGCFDDLTVNSSRLDKASLIANGEHYVQQLAKIKDNSILLFFSLMFWVMSSIIPTLLTFPNEMVVFIKERSNGWYSCFSYYVAKMLCDLPFVIICPFLFCIVFYPLTGQIGDLWRFALFYLISLLLCLIAQSLGFIIGSIFIKDKFSTIFIGSVQSFPLFMAGGYLIRESVMNWVVKPLWYISYIRYSFSAIIISIYGFGRCSNSSAHGGRSATIQSMLSNFTRPDKTLLSQVRDLVDEEDFNCLYDSYYTDSGYMLDNYFRNCNLTLANLFSRTMNQNSVDLNRQLEQEAKLYDGSFVLSYYEVSNEQFSWNIFCLVVTLVLLRAINYLIILHNVKKHSKF